MNTKESMPEIEFVLYTHFNRFEAEDWEDYKNAMDKKKWEPKCVTFLKQYWDNLKGLIHTTGKGILVIFYARGWIEVLKGVHENKGESVKDEPTVQFAEKVKERILKSIVDPELKRRVRIVTAKDLYQIFSNFTWDTAGHLYEWFVGGKMTYDSPKVIEAFLRIRLLGVGVPVFRLDHDVLFNDENKFSPHLNLGSQIIVSMHSFKKRKAFPGVSSFMFSSSYEFNQLIPNGSRDLDDWERAFATRIYPALIYEKIPNYQDELEQWLKKKNNKETFLEDRWVTLLSESMKKAFDEMLARHFLGFEPKGVLKRKADPSGIGLIGANPESAVISGALLTISDAAILDLPPYSNFHRLVSWIDDHLKFALHRELDHFVRIPGEPSRIHASSAFKGRSIQKGDFANYVFGVYIPALFLGAIMDYWIQPNPTFKFDPNFNSPREPGVFAKALKAAIKQGRLSRKRREKLYQDLREGALVRINEIYDQWSTLTKGKDGVTFAAMWVTGRGPDPGKTKDRSKKLARGMINRSTETVETKKKSDLYIIKEEDLTSIIQDELHILINDAINYIDWTLGWPKIVQAVRAVDRGSLPSDWAWTLEGPQKIS